MSSISTHFFQGDQYEKPVCYLVLACMAVVGFYLRFETVVSLPLWCDEALSWIGSRKGLWKLLTWQHHNLHPPLHYLIVRLTTDLLGTHAEWALRMPSIIAGTLCIPAVFILGTMLHSRQMGIISAFLITINPIMIREGSGARMYGVFSLLVLVCFILIVRIIQRPRTTVGDGIVLGLSITAAIWTHNIGWLLWLAILIGSISFFLVYRRGGKDELIDFPILASIGFAIVLSLILSAPAILRLQILGTFSVARAHGHFFEELFRILQGIVCYLEPTYNIQIWGAGLIILSFFGIIFIRKELALYKYIYNFFIIIYFLVLFFSAFFKGYEELAHRYLMPLLLCFFIGLGGMAAMPRLFHFRIAIWALILALTYSSAAEIFQAKMPDQYETGLIARYLREKVQADDSVYYFPRFLEHIGEYYAIPARRLPILNGEKKRCRPASHTGVTWVIAGHLYSSELPSGLQELLHNITRTYSLSYDAKKLYALTRDHQHVLISISCDGVKVFNHPREGPEMFWETDFPL